MALDVNLKDSSSGTPLEIDANGAGAVTFPGYSATGVVQFGGPAAGPAMFCENDPGEATGERFVKSPEVDSDFRIRAAHDTVLDRETFNYTAQNTGKHSHTFTTLTATVSASGLLLNSGSITTLNTGMTFGTHGQFPCGMGVTHAYFETSASFSAASPPANVVVDLGAFQRGTSTAFAPTDGAYFRFTSAGMIGVINRGGVETQTGVFNWTPEANHNYLLTVSITEKRVRFWIDDVLMDTLENHGAGQPFNSVALPWSVRHANVGGAAGGAFQTLVTDYTVSLGGPVIADDMGKMGNRTLGSYQGLSGGTMGSLATYANSANPTAAVPTNTTAALGTGLGGQVWETDTLAVTTDGVILSYQVPAGTSAVQGRRLRLTGVTIDSFVQTALTGGGYVAQWCLAFGHTAVSLATAETGSFVTATAKAPRRVGLGVQAVASGATAGTVLSRVTMTFTNPVFVNPGEFIAVVKKKIGTAPSAGVIGHLVTYDYAWE